MQKRFIQKFVSAVVVLVMLMTFAPALAQEQVQSVQVDGLLVYAEPNAASQLIAVLSLGSSVTVFTDQVTNGFTKVRIPDGREGWAILTQAGAPAGATSTGSTSSSSGNASAIVEARGNVAIRDAASVNGSRIGGIGWGEQASASNTSADGNWIFITYEGVSGWSSAAWFVIVQGALTGVSADPNASVDDGIGGGDFAPSGTIVQALGNVRLRTLPDFNADRIGLAPWGAVASLEETDNSGEWILVNYNGLLGWTASAWWVIVSGDATVVTTDGNTDPGVGGGGSAASGFGDLILYNAPNEGAVAIQVVPNGTPFDVITSDAGSGFAEIQLPDGNKGFVKLPAAPTTTLAEPSGTTSGDSGATVSTNPNSSLIGATVMAVGNVRVRSIPDLNGARVDGLAWGDLVTVSNVSADGNWIEITTPNGITGWAATVWFEVK